MSVVESAPKQLLTTGSWRIDQDHSTIEFRVKRMMIETVKGRFREFEGAIEPGDQPIFSGLIKVASLDTLHEDRDAHLRSADFFHTEQYPEIAFQSTEITFRDERVFVLRGELTIKGVTRPITLAGDLRGSGFAPDGTERIVIALSGRFEPSDFGLVWNRALETGGVLVANTVDVDLDVSVLRVS